jgi:hypothetical protein
MHVYVLNQFENKAYSKTQLCSVRYLLQLIGRAANKS